MQAKVLWNENFGNQWCPHGRWNEGVYLNSGQLSNIALGLFLTDSKLRLVFIFLNSLKSKTKQNLNKWKGKYNDLQSERKVKSLSLVRLFATPWTAAHQAPPSVGFSRQEYWGGVPLPSPGDLPNSGIELGSPTLQVDALPSKPPGKP